MINMNYSIPHINASTATAIRQGASLAFLALELRDIPNTGAVSEAIREAMRRGDRVQPIIKMVQDQWRDGACKELVRLLGGKLLRKILAYELHN